MKNAAVPIAIVVAGVLISGAVLASSNRAGGSGETARAIGENFRLPDESDHARGNADAKVSIIEFSDLECPFCARIHPTLTRIVEENPDVKWIFRHFPLTSIHSRAFGAAVASECIAKLGSNDAFWKFTDTVFENQGSMGPDLYRQFAVSVGIDEKIFDSCTKNNMVASEVSADNDEAIRSGGNGTPFVVVVTTNGTLVPFSGALPYEEVKRLVDQALVN